MIGRMHTPSKCVCVCWSVYSHTIPLWELQLRSERDLSELLCLCKSFCVGASITCITPKVPDTVVVIMTIKKPRAILLEGVTVAIISHHPSAVTSSRVSLLTQADIT